MLNLSTITPGNAYNSSQFSILFTFNIVELFSHFLLDCPFSLIIFFIIWRTSILHPNLKFILLAQSACIFVRGISRIILLIYRIALNDVATLGTPLLNFMIVQPTYVRNFIIHILVIERIMATLQFKTYEKSTGCWFSVWWFTLAFVTALFNAWANTLVDYASEINLVTYCVIILLGLLELLAFAWILQKNIGVYQKKIFDAPSLSEKYQLAENIRTAKQLIPCISLHLFNIHYGAFVNFAVYFKFFGVEIFDYEFFCNHLLYTSTTFSCFGIEFSMIMFHPRLRADLFSLFCSISDRLKFCFYSAKSKKNSTPVIDISEQQRKASAITIMNIHGKLMSPKENGELGEEYFRQLNSTWMIGPK